MFRTWAAFRRQKIDTRHTYNVAFGVLSRMSTSVTMRDRFHRWGAWLEKRRLVKTQVAAASHFMLQSTRGRQQLYFTQWMRLLKIRRDQRRAVRMAEALVVGTDRGLMLTAYHRWMHAAQKAVALRAHTKASKMAAYNLLSRFSNGQLRSAFSTWMQYLRVARQKRDARARSTLSNTLSVLTDRGVMGSTFRTWAAFRRVQIDKRRNEATVFGVMARLSTTNVLRHRLHAWERFAQERKAKRIRHQLCEAVLSTTALGALRIYFRRWEGILAVRRHKATQERLVYTFSKQTSDSRLRRAWSMWEQLLVHRRAARLQRMKESVVSNMFATTSRGTMLNVFRTWAAFRRQKIDTREREAAENKRREQLRVCVLATLTSHMGRDLMRAFWVRWVALLQIRRRARVQKAAAEAVLRLSDSSVCGVFFRRWMASVLAKRKAALQSSVRTALLEKFALKQRLTKSNKSAIAKAEKIQKERMEAEEESRRAHESLNAARASAEHAYANAVAELDALKISLEEQRAAAAELAKDNGILRKNIKDVQRHAETTEKELEESNELALQNDFARKQSQSALHSSKSELDTTKQTLADTQSELEAQQRMLKRKEKELHSPMPRSVPLL